MRLGTGVNLDLDEHGQPIGLAFHQDDPSARWGARFRIAIYGFLSVVLLGASVVGFEVKATRQRHDAEKATLARQEQQRIDEANTALAALVGEAREAWTRGNTQLADEKISAADKLADATERSPLKALRSDIANAKVETLLKTAKDKVAQGDVDAAKTILAGAMSTPHATSIQEVKVLERQLALATDADRMRAELVALSDEEFLSLKTNGTLPNNLIVEDAKVWDMTLDLARAEVAAAETIREQRLAERLAAEQRKMEAERIAAENARKAEAERIAKEKAKQEAAQNAVKLRLDAYMAVLEAADVRLVKSVSVRRIGDDGWQATLTVADIWHLRHYQLRLQDAQSLWEAWARIASPKAPDSARIKLVDQRGNEVGGSRVLGGSLIWVQEQ